jgi:hypothetical protein
MNVLCLSPHPRNPITDKYPDAVCVSTVEDFRTQVNKKSRIDEPAFVWDLVHIGIVNADVIGTFRLSKPSIRFITIHTDDLIDSLRATKLISEYGYNTTYLS